MTNSSYPSSRCSDWRRDEWLKLVFLFLTPVLCAQIVHPTRIADLQRAAALISAHQRSQARQLLTNILALDPHEARAIELLGVLEAQEGNVQSAEKQFRAALAISPALTAAHVNLGLLLLQTGKPEAALDQLETALDEEPADVSARTAYVQDATQLALVARNAGNMEQALGFLIRARRTLPDDPNLLYDFSILALQMDLRDDALAAVNQLLQIQPNNARAFYARSRIQLARQQLPQAKADMLRYLKFKPNDPSAYYGLGRIAFAQMDFPQAQADFEQSIKIQPEQTESYAMLGQIELKEDKLDQAKTSFDAALQRDPKQASALAGNGIVLYRRKDYPAAANSLRQAIAADAGLQVAHYYYGLTLARLGRKKRSEQELDLAGKMAEKQNADERARVQLSSGGVRKHP